MDRAGKVVGMKEAVRDRLASNGIAKSIAILAAAAITSRVFVSLASGERAPDYVGGTGRLIGTIIGGSIPMFVVALGAFFITRFVRRKQHDAFAELFSGAVAAVAMAALMFIGATGH
jgi:H+/gluconate symporter-like permease